MTNLFNYIDRKSPIHRLTGATKLTCLLLWSFAAMTTYDTRLLAFMGAASIALFALSRIRFRDVSFMLWFTFIFMLLNNLLVFLFSPEHGVSIYGTRHVLFQIIGRYTVTQEQLYYHLNLVLKYLSTIPIVLLFVSTTNPSEFAASLSRIGVSYKISYAVALALRYIPDIQREYRDISQAMQARGVEMTKKEKFFQRLKNAASILFPLIMSSMSKIDIIANAMELRGFGKYKKRTWYMSHPFAFWDWFSMACCAALLAVSIWLTYVDHGRFYNPFV